MRSRHRATAVTRVRARQLALLSLLCALGLGLAATPARAQNAEAELLFRDADKLMAAGDFARACEAFEASNRIEARAGTLIRLGDCREKNAQLASAWSAYSDALTRAKDPKKREIAQARVAALEPRLSQLTINVPEPSRLAELTITRNGVTVDSALWNRGAPVDGGQYAIIARAPGYAEWSTKVTVPVEAGQVTVDVPALAVRPPSLPPPDPGFAPEPVLEPVDAPRFTARRKLALGVAGGGVLVLVGAAIVGTQAKGLETDAHEACADVICGEYDFANGRLEKARSRARLANIGYGVAAAAGVAGAVLWFTGGAKAEDGVAVVPTLAPGLAGATVQGRF